MSHRIHTACPLCRGTGTRVYGNGSTWRGGMGVAAVTRDVCDACWGSGDAENPNPSPRDELDALRAALNAKGAAASGQWLADRLGLEYETVRRELPTITKRLRTMRGLGFWQGTLCDRLANALDDIATTSPPGIPDSSTTRRPHETRPPAPPHRLLHALVDVPGSRHRHARRHPHGGQVPVEREERHHHASGEAVRRVKALQCSYFDFLADRRAERALGADWGSMTGANQRRRINLSLNTERSWT